MSLHLLRRWLAAHPLSRMFVLALALALVGAQTAGVVHELSHGPTLTGGLAVTTASSSGTSSSVALSSVRPTSVAGWPSASAPGAEGMASLAAPSPNGDAAWHLAPSGDCLTCLAVAALGGAAPAPVIAVLVVEPPSTPWTAEVAVAFTPRLLRAYASRAPPIPHAA